MFRDAPPAPHLGIPRSALRIPHFFWSVNAKVLAHGRASSTRVFNPTLAGASPAADAKFVAQCQLLSKCN
jgi:hypothetical protein